MENIISNYSWSETGYNICWEKNHLDLGFSSRQHQTNAYSHYWYVVHMTLKSSNTLFYFDYTESLNNL